MTPALLSLEAASGTPHQAGSADCWRALSPDRNRIESRQRRKPTAIAASRLEGIRREDFEQALRALGSLPIAAMAMH